MFNFYFRQLSKNIWNENHRKTINFKDKLKIYILAINFNIIIRNLSMIKNFELYNVKKGEAR